nr:FMN-binding negative transcriptional regulator [Planctomycetota bacterium]
MYVPKHFSQTDDQTLLAFMRRHAFATVITRSCASLNASPLPLLVDHQPWRLTGHMARANPAWMSIDQPALVVFHGPHRYISPRWYGADDTVPTWNYLEVQATGTFSLITEDADCRSVIA